MNIYCCECKKDVLACLITGQRAYPHRKDLNHLPFWQCPVCSNFVGCHHKTKTPTKPLGNIPNQEIKNARKLIHRLLDPLWQSKKMNRGHLYAKLSKALGYEYHTAEIKSIEDARKVYLLILDMKRAIQ